MLPLFANEYVPWLCGAAFVAGGVDAVAGGGGLITVPSLLASGLSEHFAMGTNKGQAVFGALASFASFWRRKELDRARIPFAFGAAFAGSLLGAALLLAIPKEPLKPLMIGFLVVAAALVLLPKPKQSANAVPSLTRAGIIGILCGSYDGFFGPGTGSILIAAHMAFMGDRATRASGNAKVANLGSNLAAVLLFALKGKVLWHVSLPMAAANAAGAFLGARIAIGAGDRFVRLTVVVVACALVLKLLWGLMRP
jgi:uncharacterized protein